MQVETIIPNTDNHNRPHAQIKIYDSEFTGLLDSGANISILGKGGIDFVAKNNLETKATGMVIKTADGTHHIPTGMINVPVEFCKKTRNVRLYVIESMGKPLILGMNFWNCFGLGVSFCDAIGAREESPVELQHELNSEDRKKLDQTISKFVFTQPGQLSYTPLIEHDIDTADAKPIRQRPYVMSPYIQERVHEEILRMMALDILEPSINPSWMNPIIAVPKSDNRIRICLDARQLNHVTVKNAYPPQNMNRILAQLRATKYLSAIDLTDAFYQIRLKESAREKTSFAVSGKGTIRYKRMPMGLCNSGATLCQLVDRIFGNALEPEGFVYLDDFLLTSADFLSHLILLERVAEILKKAGLTISANKSRFCMARLKYLGFVLDHSGLHPDPDRVAAMKNYPAPRNVREIRRLLGIIGWYRRFLKKLC